MTHRLASDAVGTQGKKTRLPMVSPKEARPGMRNETKFRNRIFGDLMFIEMRITLPHGKVA
jgi:hypothetical protein